MKLWTLLTTAMAGVLAAIGTFIAYTSTMGCIIFIAEEPKMPDILIK